MLNGTLMLFVSAALDLNLSGGGPQLGNPSQRLQVGGLEVISGLAPAGYNDTSTATKQFNPCLANPAE